MKHKAINDLLLVGALSAAVLNDPHGWLLLLLLGVLCAMIVEYGDDDDVSTP
jgi:hypothetical protein